MLVKCEPKVCKHPECKGKFYFLRNPETGKMIPVDLASLSEQEIQAIEGFLTVTFDKWKHVSHFKTCKDPNRFSSKKK